MMKWSVSYAEAESVLASLHGATAEVQRKAFRGRLQHLKRLGIPIGINPGRGAKIRYREEQLYEWAFCLELAEFGLDPSLIVQIMKNNRKEILDNLTKAREAPNGDDLYFVTNPNFLTASWAVNRPLRFRFIPLSDTKRLVQRLYGQHRRAILINISDLFRRFGEGKVDYYSKRNLDEPGE
jgi:hypothetical protein